jgi:kynurenine formamidase
MCSPRVAAIVREAIAHQPPRVDRRRLMGAGAAALAGSAVAPMFARAQSATPVATPVRAAGPMFSAFHDLTHVASPSFPMFPGAAQMQIDLLVTIEDDGFYKNTLTLDEHTGTHMDAPAHFIPDGTTADLLPIENFFAPLCVVDISARATDDPDATVTVDDLAEWEAANGPIPDGAFLAMNSGWADRVNDAESFINLDADGVQHYPGFSGEAAAFLVDERVVVGIGSDTLSLDPGNSTDFIAHVTALGAGLYGIEGLANLSSPPAAGAMVIIGGPKHENASGGPSRVYAVEPQ